MNKSVSVMKNVQEVCSELRKSFFGEHASVKDYKDSFVINKTIESYNESPEALIADTISVDDQKETKISKSINFRSDCYEKICTYSKLLEIPESEVCRRILYYSLEKLEKDKNEEVTSNIQLSALKSKVALLRTQLDKTLFTLNEIVKEIDKMEA